ncbi:MAG: HEPN domain-containing protein [Candidatus Berkelbacteria bacterium Licking1014_85]|uniref:HEPN domain-containing protein n=1 Tax=Candidatus Berkelbacteria bacterium Licking1014_85 TaxID=2017148 RepID=A0A554LFN3_9BACT|nr:MAG: HEPN domain-containing protein [Candidatus Berkelbacteria bacterium Licking1014_85]
MSQEFKKCLERGKIKRFSPGKKLVGKELKLAEEDLKISLRSLSDGNYKWSIIQSYYSMFHSARALLYSKNYREKSHFCLIEAVRTLFVETGKIKVLLVESFLEAKNLREAADYYGDFSELNCKKLTKKAEEFLKAAREIIE